MSVRSVHVCQQCGSESPKWSGQCPSCGAWNTLVETVVPKSSGARSRPARTALRVDAVAQPIGAVSSAEADRLTSGIGEVDRVLGGGFVPGSIVLIGGDPGIGKSTLLLQLAARIAVAGSGVLYITGEESPAQVRGRGRRAPRSPLTRWHSPSAPSAAPRRIG